MATATAEQTRFVLFLRLMTIQDDVRKFGMSVRAALLADADAAASCQPLLFDADQYVRATVARRRQPAPAPRGLPATAATLLTLSKMVNADDLLDNEEDLKRAHDQRTCARCGQETLLEYSIQISRGDEMTSMLKYCTNERCPSRM